MDPNDVVNELNSQKPSSSDTRNPPGNASSRSTAQTTENNSFTNPAMQFPNSYICGNCGTIGQPSSVTKGSIWIEIILWLCCLFPGIIYSVWRLTTRTKACPSCKATNIMPINSPMGTKLYQSLYFPQKK